MPRIRTPHERSNVSKSRSLTVAAAVATRDRGYCIYCPIEPESQIAPQHAYPHWYAVHLHSIPPDRLPTIEPVNPLPPPTPDPLPADFDYDALDNFVTVCKTHYKNLLYPDDPNPPRDPYVQPQARQALYRQDRDQLTDLLAISLKVPKRLHSIIKQQGRQEHIAVNVLYRRILSAGLALYLNTDPGTLTATEALFPARLLTDNSPKYELPTGQTPTLSFARNSPIGPNSNSVDEPTSPESPTEPRPFPASLIPSSPRYDPDGDHVEF